jgi:hypothetical protein
LNNFDQNNNDLLRSMDISHQKLLGDGGAKEFEGGNQLDDYEGG